MKKNLIIFAAVLALLVLSFLIGRRDGVKKTHQWYADNMDTTTVVTVDTNKVEDPIHDTTYLDKPVYYPVYVEGEPAEPQIIYRDSVHYILLDRTFKEYRTDDYYAKISGVEPNLDYIETYNKTVTNTVYVPQAMPKKLEFVELDARIVYNGIPMAPVTANIGHVYGPLEVYAGGGYDFLQKKAAVQIGGRLRFGF